MPARKLKPTSPGTRFRSVPSFEGISSGRPLKSLVKPLKKSGGRNNQGKVSVRFRGAGHRRNYRVIDFRRDKENIPARVASLEYDPNRSSRIALLHYADGEKRYILAPGELKVGDSVVSGPQADIKPGNSLPLQNIPLGTAIHNIELTKGKGAQLVRSAGGSAQLLAKEGSYGHIKLPSGEIRLVHLGCSATVGQVGNPDHRTINFGKAGRSRWLGRRPHVRGAAMNPVDHPHGGGEGRVGEGRPPVSPWGKSARGVKTRKKRANDRMRIKRRK